MNVLVVGGGRVGSRLCEVLEDDGHRVTVVEKDETRCAVLQERFRSRGIRVVCGDGNDPAILIEAGVRETQALAAATGDDEDNLVVGLLGKREFGVPRLVGKINNPANAWLYNERMGIDAAVDPAMVIAKLLEEEASIGEVVPLLKMPSDDVLLVQVEVAQDAGAVGHSVADLTIPQNTAVVAVIRGQRILTPCRDIILQGGDQVIALCRATDEDELAHAVKSGR